MMGLISHLPWMLPIPLSTIIQPKQTQLSCFTLFYQVQGYQFAIRHLIIAIISTRPPFIYQSTCTTYHFHISNQAEEIDFISRHFPATRTHSVLAKIYTEPTNVQRRLVRSASCPVTTCVKQYYIMKFCTIDIGVKFVLKL